MHIQLTIYQSSILSQLKKILKKKNQPEGIAICYKQPKTNTDPLKIYETSERMNERKEVCEGRGYK